jgi:hypothetical protein
MLTTLQTLSGTLPSPGSLASRGPPAPTKLTTNSDASNLPPHSVRVVNIEKITQNRPLKAKTVAPLTFVLFIGFSLSVLLLALSIWLRDGMSIISTVLLSLLSSLIGLGNKWKLELPKRNKNNSKVPGGDVVIRYPKGSFLVVRCNEDVARELYFAPEAITYLLQHGPAYRLLSLIGTVMLMGGVICLANARIESQMAWAGSYMLLGSSYWIVAALPGKMHWDTSAYKVTEECLSDSNFDKKGFPSENETFTQALWKAIVVCKETHWVRISNACPDTPTWTDWLNMARACSKDVRCIEEKEKTEQLRVIQQRKSGLEKRDVKIKVWEVPDWKPQQYFIDLLEEKEKGHGKLATQA